VLIVVVLTMAVMKMLEGSRTGRGWRAVREDPLAAAAMTVPVDRVKLMAFAFGAMIAALAGSIFAAQQVSVFPPDFNTAYLILIYAGLILGGAGSVGGAVVGRGGPEHHPGRRPAQPHRRRLRLLRRDPGDIAGQDAPMAETGRRTGRDRPRSGSRRMPSPAASRPARWPAALAQAAGSAARCTTG